jgi:hypothetical protein
MKRSVLVAVLLSASWVFAQEELPAPPAQPAPAAQPAPPALAAPPARPPDLAERIRALEESGHEKKTAGAVLQASGGVVAFTGVVLLVAASWADDGACARNDDQRWAVQSFTSGSPSGSRSTSPPSCGDNGLAMAGGLTLVLGVAMILPGVAITRSGIGDLERAHELRRPHSVDWFLRPSASAQGGRVDLAMKF